MTAAELKLKIFRQIDSLEKSNLEGLYGVLMNYINGQKEENDWVNLSDPQKQGILDALDEIESGKGIAHDKVMNKFRKKYRSA